MGRSLLFKVDENLPVQVSETLQSAGYDAVSVLDQRLGGAADPEVAEVCRQETRVLVTLDVGFGDIRTYRPRSHAGILVLRPRTQQISHVIQLLQRVLSLLERESIEGALWIVEETRVRIRT